MKTKDSVLFELQYLSKMLGMFWTQIQNDQLNSAQSVFGANNLFFLRNFIHIEDKRQWHIMCRRNTFIYNSYIGSLDATPESDFKSTISCKIQILYILFGFFSWFLHHPDRANEHWSNVHSTIWSFSLLSQFFFFFCLIEITIITSVKVLNKDKFFPTRNVYVPALHLFFLFVLTWNIFWSPGQK